MPAAVNMTAKFAAIQWTSVPETQDGAGKVVEGHEVTYAVDGTQNDIWLGSAWYRIRTLQND